MKREKKIGNRQATILHTVDKITRKTFNEIVKAKFPKKALIIFIKTLRFNSFKRNSLFVADFLKIFIKTYFSELVHYKLYNLYKIRKLNELMPVIRVLKCFKQKENFF